MSSINSYKDFIKFASKLPMDIVNDIMEYNADHKPIMDNLMFELIKKYFTLYEKSILYADGRHSITQNCFDNNNPIFIQFSYKNILTRDLNNKFNCVYCQDNCIEEYNNLNIKQMIDKIDSGFECVCPICNKDLQDYYEQLEYEIMLDQLNDDDLDLEDIRYFRNMRI